ncbi:transglycosylase SLT domain-containing protein [Ralstonia solanacearum]|uniref:Membrane-bound lytic murein transglycosylase d n=1 Tax=Ralstonia solanacearum (strain Po82) TaxID=1031711 RepID=F6G0M1_RALS8|nr:transglycosylase SLT domain-containing protein [Ralstonia solanacearum]AEG68865.1 membrane-bound lytic murein transglycosylase d [Ralstonia solanacearum Po82]AMP70761.1 lytic transglycosylase [Ralstonia solanacearum]AMP73044.1 lytic transglycosylase [Ralstonia solanacearum]AYB60460.1 lytic transglycosylase [Ralstonia solanacearum]MBB6588021.1 transglycosylase SLT domain-containing protein [Ralstonia solanacearum]
MRSVRLLAASVFSLLLAACATAPAPNADTASTSAVSSSSGNDGPVVNVDQQPVASLKGPAKDLWARIRQGFSMPDLQSSAVDDRADWYAQRPEAFRRMVDRSNRYLYHIVEELERRNMPTELALLPFVESAFNPQAVSSAKAAGMWQFIPSTGKTYNLRQNVFQDERRDVLASTDAALDYLSKLHDQFGDWQLALAAYNWGEGAVARAIARNQAAGQSTDYLNLNMPAETRMYVPKLQAIKNIITNPERYGIALPDIPNHPYFVTVTTSRDIDVSLAARLANLPLDEFKALNPSFNRPVILGASNPQILLPYDNAETFQYNLNTYHGGLSSWTAVTVGNRERVEALAARLKVDPDTIREINRIPKGMRLKAGSTVVVPRAEDAKEDAPDISPELAENAIMAVEPDVPDLRRVVVRAGKQDTLAGLSRRYGVSVAQLRAWNQLSGDAIPRGHNVVLMLPQARSGGHVRAVRVSAASRPAAAAVRAPVAKVAGKPVARAKPLAGAAAKRRKH